MKTSSILGKPRPQVQGPARERLYPLSRRAILRILAQRCAPEFGGWGAMLRFFMRWTLTLFFLIAFTVQLLHVPLSLWRPPSFQIGTSDFAIAQWIKEGSNRSHGYSLTINPGPLGTISAVTAGILTLTKFTQRKQA